jgi:hypothetical protein
MIKLKDLLFEQTEDLRPIAMDFLKAVKQKVGSSTPNGFGGFEVAWSTRYHSEVTILFDTPREIRHPDEYFDQNYELAPHTQKKVDAWNKLDDAVWQVVGQFQKKNKDIEFGQAGSISGGGIRTTGSPRMSSF